MSELPTVVVGAGPAGLATAAELLERGLEPLVLEAGPGAGAAVAQWGQVRMFSPWAELVDPAAGRLLAGTRWQHPAADAYPTGAEWVEQYLKPLAEALGGRIRFGSRVVGVARRGRDRVVDAGRDTEPLTVHVLSADGVEQRITARALVDASGTWGKPNPLGGDGLPAIGEASAADRIVYRVPDLGDPVLIGRYAGKHVAVAGSGHSALTALVVLAEFAEAHPGTRVSWVLRRGGVGNAFGGGSDDELPARGALGLRAQAAVQAGRIRVVGGFRCTEVERTDSDLLTLVSDADADADARAGNDVDAGAGADVDAGVDAGAGVGARVEDVDEVIVLAGFRPDLSWLSELRLDLDPVLQAPTKLAPLIDPNVHSCGTVSPHGAAELAHPEPGVFLVGMKSYGRAPTFLAMTGYEQVRSIAAKLAGDDAAAARVELTLPDTGVCGGSGGFDDGARILPLRGWSAAE
ncbi:MAG TPA: FAD-dependent oxidoreductase [Kineosporiaceae bacterium]|nr:FAD-dependent oxidoreductase [Kineosporiaceae bacterium]